ncbi:sensor histidine kinase [Halobacillus kuroshimensis]|uniref:histidine kinase n=1 Tax=Halobacillus kuroshimensis TaxID=302481 RepID=A0ABS3DY87_9BACI|nr:MULTISPECIES: sensor histidine kinase [Halobacillus]MBN8236325.1 sensor histidine kinase [Halobacillus kuroshimensis]
MIFTYMRERLSWILLFVSLQLLALLIGYLDSSLPFRAVTYYVFLSLIIFSVFLILRFQKETRFYKRLEERDNDLDLTTIPEAESPLESVIETSIREQLERLKKEAAHHHDLLQEEKDDLLGWIHEVKTPMTAMKLMIEGIEDYPLRSRLTYEWMRIHLLLDQQLHRKRIPFIENDLYIEETALEPLLFSEIKTLRSWCMQKGIGFDLELNQKSVLTDAKWLSFIIRQLLSNAIKYSTSSDITVTSGRKSGRSFVTIIDQGRGIAAQDIPRIFEKGFTSTTDHYNEAASGMGLYLVDRIRRPLNIELDVQSQPGLGSMFTLWFPEPNTFTKIRNSPELPRV